MREYKRLTKHVNGKLVLTKDKASYSEIYYESLRIKEALQRLADLEDKIEAGTLIELPCKVGDTVYVIPSLPKVAFNIIEKEEIFNNIKSRYVSKVDYIVGNEYEKLGVGEYFNTTWFLTYEEAEAKLKEYIEKAKALLEKSK